MQENDKWKFIHLQFELYWTKSVECIVKCKKNPNKKGKKNQPQNPKYQ